MKVYIAGPYSIGDTAANVRRALEAAEKVRELGHLPFVPHLTHFWHLVFPHPYEYWIAMDNEWLLECDALLRLPGESVGADGEVAWARHCDLRVFYGLDDFEAGMASE